MTKPRRISTLTAVLLTAALAGSAAGDVGRPRATGGPPSLLAAVEALLHRIAILLVPDSAVGNTVEPAASGEAGSEGIGAPDKNRDDGPVIDPIG